MDLRTSLEQIGLTKTEAKVYLELFKLGSTKSGPLVRKTELHRATVYDVLKRLLEKGLASYIIREKTKYFETSSPEHLLDVLEEEKKEARPLVFLVQKKSFPSEKTEGIPVMPLRELVEWCKKLDLDAVLEQLDALYNLGLKTRYSEVHTNA